MGQGFALFAGVAPEIIRASAREAEGLGYTSFWVNHPGATDGLVSLALAATETRRIELGIGVIPLHTRGPDSIVQGVRANGLPLDRLLLGVGSANPGALKRVRDGVAALRPKLAARLVVAALGPQMCRVAGEVGDGVLFNWLTPEHARRSADWVRAGAAAAGRQPPRLFAPREASPGNRTPRRRHGRLCYDLNRLDSCRFPRRPWSDAEIRAIAPPPRRRSGRVRGSRSPGTDAPGPGAGVPRSRPSPHRSG